MSDEGPAKRIGVYRSPPPHLGECVDSESLALLSTQGQSEVVAHKTTGPDRGSFRYSSKLLSIEAKGEASLAGKSAAEYSVTSHELVMEWSRYETATIETSTKQSPCDFVSAVESGAAIRVIFDVRLRNASVETNLSFGFGSLAAAIANNGAEVMVRYDTVGVLTDILPSDAPTNVTSINDLLRVQNAMYQAIHRISVLWNTATGVATGSATPPTAEEKKVAADQFSYAPVAYYVTKTPAMRAAEQAERSKALEVLTSSAVPTQSQKK